MWAVAHGFVRLFTEYVINESTNYAMEIVFYKSKRGALIDRSVKLPQFDSNNGEGFTIQI